MSEPGNDRVALDVRGVSKRFGGVRALTEVSFRVGVGEIFGLIGANGAGKTTLFNVVTGFTPASAGRVWLFDDEITTRPPYLRVRTGMARTFQTPQLFKAMTVRENILSGAYARQVSHMASNVFRSRKRDQLERCDRLLAQFGLLDVAEVSAAELAYGQQRRLEIARGMMTAPRLLMLDEPAAGMLPNEVEELRYTIQKIRDDGCTVLLVEHNMRLIMNICDRITVLEFGRNIATGTPAEIRVSPDVIRAYLGEAH